MPVSSALLTVVIYTGNVWPFIDVGSKLRPIDMFIEYDESYDLSGFNSSQVRHAVFSNN